MKNVLFGLTSVNILWTVHVTEVTKNYTFVILSTRSEFYVGIYMRIMKYVYDVFLNVNVWCLVDVHRVQRSLLSRLSVQVVDDNNTASHPTRWEALM